MKDIVFTKQNLNEYFLYSLFLLSLLGTSLPAYIVVICFLLYKISHLKFKIQDFIFLLAIVLWFILKVKQIDLNSSIILFRYYFGFYVFYLFFNNVNIDLRLDKLLWVICGAIVLEAILINTIVSSEWLPNYPKNEIGEFGAQTKIFGFYQRPYSIGTSSTITSTLVMVLIFYVFGFTKDSGIDKSKVLLIFSIFTVLILVSGTGYVLLLLFGVYKIGPFKNLLSAIISIGMLFLIYYLIFIADIGSLDGLDKISSAYLEFLYYFKIMQIDDVIYYLRAVPDQIFIGKAFEDSKQLVIWSDFAWLNLFECTGYLGFFITISIFLFKTNRYNYIPIFVFFIGAIHYGAIYSLPGQLLFGYFASTKFKNKEKAYLMDISKQ